MLLLSLVGWVTNIRVCVSVCALSVCVFRANVQESVQSVGGKGSSGRSSA